jgi:hypothetical protein
VSVHSGVTTDDLRERTGFDVAVGGELPVTPAPPPEHVAILRQLVDPTGTLNADRAA